jgi:hypothetical protein
MNLRVATLGWVLATVCSVVFAADDHDAIERGLFDPAGKRIRSDTYLMSVLYTEDDASAVRAAASFGLGSNSQLLVDLAYVHSPIEFDDLSTYRGGVSFGHDFARFGFDLGYEYWGDRDRIDTHTLRGSLSYRWTEGRIALLAERRNIDLKFDVPAGARNFIANSKSGQADGFGVSARYSLDTVDMYASGMLYNYNTDIGSLRSNIDLSRLPPPLRAAVIARLDALTLALRRLNGSSLTLANSFLDSTVSAGVDVRFGTNTLNIELSHDVLVTDKSTVNDIGIGWLHALCGVCDIEYRIGLTKDEIVGTSLYGGVMFYWYH